VKSDLTIPILIFGFLKNPQEIHQIRKEINEKIYIRSVDGIIIPLSILAILNIQEAYPVHADHEMEVPTYC